MLKQGSLGNAIRTSRIENHMSQEELAEIVDITPTHLKHLESEHRKPSVEVLFKLVKTLRFSLDDLIFENETSAYKKADMLIKECTEKELKMVTDIIKAIQNNR